MARLLEGVLEELTPDVVSCERYAEAVDRFLAARDSRGVPYVKPGDRLVGVGHSLGGCTA